MVTPRMDLPERRGVLQILKYAVWFGLVLGLVEGALRYGLQKAGWLVWKWSFAGVTVEVLWLTALVNLVLFLGPGAFWSLFDVLFGKRIPTIIPAVFTYTFVASIDLLKLSGRLSGWGGRFFALGIACVVVRAFRARGSRLPGLVDRTLPWAVAAILFTMLGTEGSQWAYEEIAVARRKMPRPEVPNVLVVVVDALRADHLSGFGYSRPTSPAIDNLMREGVTFENAIATSSWTLPTHASLLTGRYAFDHGGTDDLNYVPKDLTLGETLQGVGYRTAAFSANRSFFTKRWGFDRGFDRFSGLFATAEAVLGRTVLGAEIIAKFDRLFPEVTEREDAAVIAGLASRWIRHGADRPFFVVINFYGTHGPYRPPQPYDELFRDRPPNLRLGVKDQRFGVAPENAALSLAVLEKAVNGYDGALRNIDDRLKSLLAEIAGASRRETLVVITADHGESFGEHGLMGHKTSLYREQIRVPLIFWGLPRIPRGKRIATPVSVAAIPATITDLLGLAVGNQFPVPSVTSLWGQPNAVRPVHDPISEISHYPFGPLAGTPVFHGAMAAVVTERWHYIQHQKFGPELYDWSADPDLQKDVAATTEGKEVCSRLASYLKNLRAQKGN